MSKSILFSETIGLDGPKIFLSSLIKSGQSFSNLIFIGPSGCGKTTLALNFSKTVACQQKMACNQCFSCQLFLAGNHPDFFIVKPQGFSIKLNQIKELEDLSFKQPVTSEKKIFYIKNADCMGLEAANSFLKIFEESKSSCLYILSTALQTGILPTLLSRGIRVHFPPPSLQYIPEILKTKFKFDDADANQYQYLFQWGFKTNWLQNWHDFITWRQSIFTALASADDADFNLLWTKLLNTDNETSYRLILDLVFSYFRDLLIFKHRQVELAAHQDMLSYISASRWQQVAEEEIINFLTKLAKAQNYINLNTDAKSAIFSLILELKALSAG